MFKNLLEDNNATTCEITMHAFLDNVVKFFLNRELQTNPGAQRGVQS